MTETNISTEDAETLRRLGFEPRYYLCRHPGWPDPLNIWPPTAENAQRTYDEYPHPDAYVLMKWEKGPRSVFLAPRPSGRESVRCVAGMLGVMAR